MARYPTLSNSYKNITVDIFDTILYRKIWPEEMQFLIVAQNWSMLLKNKYNINIDYYELFTYRRDVRHTLVYAKKMIQKNDTKKDYEEITINEWFSTIIKEVAKNNKLNLNDKKIKNILNDFINIELQTEQENLGVNKKLVKWLRHNKKLKPRIKIYFLSDMYLSSEHIKKLLNHFDLSDIFDDGFSSSDLNNGKWSGRMYSYLNNANIRMSNNLHVGDNLHSDYNIAIKSGSDAILIKGWHNNIYKPMVTKYNTYKFNKVITNNRKKIRETFNKEITQLFNESIGNKTTTTACKIGSLFGAPVLAYLDSVLLISKYSKIKMVAVSSEANCFKEIINRTPNKSYDKIIFEPAINRKICLHYATYKVIQNEMPIYNPEIIKIFLSHGENIYDNKNIYQFLTNNTYSTMQSRLVLESANSKALNKMIQDVMGNNKKMNNYSEKIIMKLLNGFKNNDEFILLDVGWNGTIQALLQEISRLLKKDITINGLYIGAKRISHVSHLHNGTSQGLIMHDIDKKPDKKIFVPEIWEYMYTNKHYGIGINKQTHNGLLTSIDLFYSKKICASPMEYYYAIKPSLVRFFRSPTNSEIRLFGNIEFDSGFVNSKKITLVDTSQNIIKVYKNLLLHPKKSVNKMIAQYCWTAGYIKFYKIGLLAKILLTIANKKTGKDLY